MLARLYNRLKSRSIFARALKRYNDYVRLCLTSGYVAKTRKWLLGPSRLVFAAWRFMQVGPTKVVGAENLRLNARLIFCPNHSSLLDAIVIHPSLHGAVRYMGAYESMQGLCGLKPILLTAIGAFAVDRQNGNTVVEPATKLLVAGERLMIFPEGKIYNSGKLGRFKLGPARIARAAYDRLSGKEDVGIVPVHICYGKRHEKSGETFNFFKMAFFWRGGCTIYVGKPIWISQNKALTDCQLMDLVKQGICRFPCPTSGQ